MMRRYGWVRVNGRFIDPENKCIRLMMREVIVLDIRRHYDRNEVDYLVFCDLMDTLPEGTIAPFYDAVFSGDPIHVEFHRRAHQLGDEQ